MPHPTACVCRLGVFGTTGRCNSNLSIYGAAMGKHPESSVGWRSILVTWCLVCTINRPAFKFKTIYSMVRNHSETIPKPYQFYPRAMITLLTIVRQVTSFIYRPKHLYHPPHHPAYTDPKSAHSMGTTFPA